MKDLRLPAKQAWQGTEQSFQKEISAWLKKALYNAGLPNVYYHIPNERKMTPAQASRLKAQGVLRGASDVVLPIKSGEYSGIYCELKAKRGCPSPEQKAFLNAVAGQGFLAVVINDLSTFKKVFSYYINNTTKK